MNRAVLSNELATRHEAKLVRNKETIDSRIEYWHGEIKKNQGYAAKYDSQLDFLATITDDEINHFNTSPSNSDAFHTISDKQYNSDIRNCILRTMPRQTCDRERCQQRLVRESQRYEEQTAINQQRIDDYGYPLDEMNRKPGYLVRLGW
ncbi:hypothetical protein ACQKPX_07205 [Photobacterium sp. DNB23_23_1]|uniref:Uncharacterized protein n=1 Tax=Photobacterium pectinilyticum TaxID=2906793 RepID=A0ABT1NBZ2_9GAMM|nr:hypothetical protein [Photobacterium sp. ZSDE20]MCQ1061334.1 hypothetical protein [Photobacterium sp. ZSDE20]MDD1829998.1 hypothetical protein [Photobacterium sp. ZSDE20]